MLRQSASPVMMSATVGSPENRHLQARLAEERNRNRAALRACVERAVASGELSSDIDPAAPAGVSTRSSRACRSKPGRGARGGHGHGHHQPDPDLG